MSKITLTNYDSGELLISDEEGNIVSIPREAAYRIILAARMHSVADFFRQLPKMLPNPVITGKILAELEKTKTQTERWNLKEKFARLTTLAKGYEPKTPSRISEKIPWN